jgi:hypothetical protein
MSALAITDLPHRSDAPDAGEDHRRRMLAESDRLLDRVERLRLAGQKLCPALLSDAVRVLQVQLGRLDGARPRTVRAAHNLLFGLQARLMAANPRNLRPRPQPDRPVGVSRISILRQGGAWKFLALPPPPPPAGGHASGAAEWLRLIDLTVQRALDRWASAQDQAVGAARDRKGAIRALHRARAAWRNYWELRCEAEALWARAAARGGVGARPAGASGGGGGPVAVAAATRPAATRPAAARRHPLAAGRRRSPPVRGPPRPPGAVRISRYNRFDAAGRDR